MVSKPLDDSPQPDEQLEYVLAPVDAGGSDFDDVAVLAWSGSDYSCGPAFQPQRSVQAGSIR